VEILCNSCFYKCQLLSSITFEFGSHLQRIEESAFSMSDLTPIIIPSSVDLLCKSCFAVCDSIELIMFKNNLKLARIESRAFHGCSEFVRISESLLSKFQAVPNCSIVASTTPDWSSSWSASSSGWEQAKEDEKLEDKWKGAGLTQKYDNYILFCFPPWFRCNFGIWVSARKQSIPK
jgi:hypothetical protein